MSPKSDSAAVATPPASPEGDGETLRLLMPSQIGNLGLEIHDGAVTHLAIDPKGKLRKSFTPIADLPSSDFLDEVFGRMSEFLAGARPSPALEWSLDRSELDPFSKKVLKAAAKIPYGATKTYRQIAKAAGNIEAYRLVLATLKINPLPLVIPCHRIVTNKSGIGSYIGGQDRKRWLLAMEKEGLRV